MLASSTGQQRRLTRKDSSRRQQQTQLKGDVTEKKTRRVTKPLPMKKERKKRMKKIDAESADLRSMTNTNSSESKSTPETVQIKQEDDLMANCPLLESSSSLSHPIFDSIVDQNSFWHQNQFLPTGNYYLPMNSSSTTYDHRTQFSPSDMEGSQSPIAENSSSSKIHSNQSRKDKSLGLLCQRFISMYPPNVHPGEMIVICLDKMARVLETKRRRIYDIVNVLESVETMSRIAKNQYQWHGLGNLAHTLSKLKTLAYKSGFVEFARSIREQIDQMVLSGQLNTGQGTQNEALKCIQIVSTGKNVSSSENDEVAREEKALGIMAQKFLMLFLTSDDRIVNIIFAAKVLLGDSKNEITEFGRYKTKVRRLYDIANVLSTINLITKVTDPSYRGPRPAFQYIGPRTEIIHHAENVVDFINSENTKSNSKHSLFDHFKRNLFLNCTIPRFDPRNGLLGLKSALDMSGRSSSGVTVTGVYSNHIPGGNGVNASIHDEHSRENSPSESRKRKYCKTIDIDHQVGNPSSRNLQSQTSLSMTSDDPSLTFDSTSHLVHWTSTDENCRRRSTTKRPVGRPPKKSQLTKSIEVTTIEASESNSLIETTPLTDLQIPMKRHPKDLQDINVDMLTYQMRSVLPSLTNAINQQNHLLKQEDLLYHHCPFVPTDDLIETTTLPSINSFMNKNYLL